MRLMNFYTHLILRKTPRSLIFVLIYDSTFLTFFFKAEDQGLLLDLAEDCYQSKLRWKWYLMFHRINQKKRFLCHWHSYELQFNKIQWSWEILTMACKIIYWITSKQIEFSCGDDQHFNHNLIYKVRCMRVCVSKQLFHSYWSDFNDS